MSPPAKLRALAALPVMLLAGCAAAAPESPAHQANLANCTAQADAVYRQDNLDGLARTGQNGLYFAPMPNHVFDAQRMGSMSARDREIQACMDQGSAGLPGSKPLPAPQIVPPTNPSPDGEQP